MIFYTLTQLRDLPVAHTDAGDFLYVDGSPKKEFLVRGTITKERAGLFFLDIDGERFTAHKQEGFSQGEEVICILTFQMKENNIDFVVRSLEKNSEV